MRFGFGIWAGITLFWGMYPVGTLAEGDGRWIGVGFGPRGRRGNEW